MGETTGRWPSASAFLMSFRLHELDVADEADVHGLPLLVGPEDLLAEVHVVARHAERVGAAGLEGFADLPCDPVVEGLLDDLDGRGVGDAHAAPELGLDAGLVHGPGDRLAAAVHDDDLDADGGQEGDVGGHAVPALRIRIIHEPAAVLHHEGGATELVDVRKRLVEDLGFLRGRNAHLAGRSVGTAAGEKPKTLFALVVVHVAVGEVRGQEPELGVAEVELQSDGETAAFTTCFHLGLFSGRGLPPRTAGTSS
jgi:hypothetical protein